MSLIDRKHLIIIKSDVIIRRVSNSIRVRDIDHRLHDNSEYIELNFYILEKLFDDSTIIAHFRREIHIVDDFRVNVLLEVNIINFEKVVFDFDFRIITLRDCDDLQTSMNIVFKNFRIIRVVRSIDFLIISIHICMTVLVKIRECNLSKDRDYNFEFKQNFQVLNSEKNFFNHITDVQIIVVQIRNVNNKSYILFKNVKINMLRNYEEKNCYNTSSNNRHFAIVFSRSWIKILRNVVMMNLVEIFANFINQAEISSSAQVNSIISITDVVSQVQNDSSNSLFILKIVMFIDITVFDEQFIYNRLFTVTNAYSKIWRDIEKNIVNISENQWMFISILSNAKSNVNKIYFFNSKDKKIINKKFDRFHKKDKLSWTDQFTFYDYSMFVIWRIVNDKRKSKIMINIRDLNKMSMFDVYSMSLQFDIFFVVMSAFYISVMNYASFFH